MKKYIYPPIFSIGFLVFREITIRTINAIPEGYGGLGIGMVILLAWLIIAIPIYCLIYRKIVINEKFRILFSAYNFLLISVSHILPFNLQGAPTIVILFIIWVMAWNAIP